MDRGQYFLKIRKPNAYHSSEGMGEGFVSLLYIIDALYDSKEGDCIAIDEPELSLHPALQRKMAKLLLSYSATRQIVLATHSPYFTSIDALGAGATIARVHLKNEGSVISQLTKDTAARLSGLIRNHNNPHILGLDAREVFFLEDQVILLEGQEDVVFFPRIAEQLCPDLPGTAYGWGVGGADNMDVIAQLLSELGFSKVAGVLDANRPEVAARLQKKFPNYNFFLIPANDIRTKRAQPAKDAIQGLLDETNSRIRPEFIEEATRVLNQIKAYLTTNSADGAEPDEGAVAHSV
jgi:AAA domain, putative AbiEii toxin, Type IV TA system